MTHPMLFNELRLQRDYLLGLATKAAVDKVYTDEESMGGIDQFAQKTRKLILETASQTRNVSAEEIRSYGTVPDSQGD